MENMNTANTEKVLTEAKEVSLQRAFISFSSFISHSPRKRIRLNMYNKYGQCSEVNKYYGKQLTLWKKTKLFPFFLANGWSRVELNEAWKKSVFKK